MPASEWLVPKLQGWATQMSGRFGGARVWLVGSALTKDHPRDIDIIISVPDALFAARYGVTPDGPDGKVYMAVVHGPNWSAGWRKWHNEQCHITERLTLTYPGLVLDVKVHPDNINEGLADAARLRGDPAAIRLDLMDEPWPTA